MELVLLGVALFVFCFGSVIAMTLFEKGLSLGERCLGLSQKLISMMFKTLIKLIVVGVQTMFRSIRNKRQQYQVSPIIITPLQLQQMRNNQLTQSRSRIAYQIEQPQLIEG